MRSLAIAGVVLVILQGLVGGFRVLLDDQTSRGMLVCFFNYFDAGSAGAGNFPGFRRHVIEKSAVRILATADDDNGRALRHAMVEYQEGLKAQAKAKGEVVRKRKGKTGFTA